MSVDLGGHGFILAPVDELTRCLEILGLRPGALQEEVKKAYRELVMVWHPDRFATDSPLHAKAEEKVRELNAAYEFVTAHGFSGDQPIIPASQALDAEPGTAAETPGWETTEEAPRGGRNVAVSVWALLLVLIAAGGVTWWWNESRSRQTLPATAASLETKPDGPTPPPTASAQAPTPVDSQSPTPFDPNAPSNLLHTMRPVGGCKVTTNADSLSLTGAGSFCTRDECEAPFIIRASVKTDLANIRLAFGQGAVILNWEGNPGELRMHDPATSQIRAVPGRGKVPPEQWQDLEWEFQTNHNIVRVNGQERARFEGNYSGLSDVAGFWTLDSATTSVRYFGVQRLEPLKRPQIIDLRAGLVLYFPFDADEKDRVTDHSGMANHGRVQGATFVPMGRVGGAMRFRGFADKGDRIAVPHSPSLVSMQRTRQLTLCAWLKPDSLPREFPVVLGKGGDWPPRAFGGYEFTLNSYRTHDLRFMSGGSHAEAGSQWVSSRPGQWIHVAVVADARVGRVKFYVDGQRTADEAYEGPGFMGANFVLPNVLFIGGPDPGHHRNRSWFDGLMDEVRVYARVLSPEEIRALPGLAR